MEIFEIGKTYKIMMDKNFDQNSIYTITVTSQDEQFLKGIDLKGQKRGVTKTHIIDFLEM